LTKLEKLAIIGLVVKKARLKMSLYGICSSPPPGGIIDIKHRFHPFVFGVFRFDKVTRPVSVRDPLVQDQLFGCPPEYRDQVCSQLTPDTLVHDILPEHLDTFSHLIIKKTNTFNQSRRHLERQAKTHLALVQQRPSEHGRTGHPPGGTSRVNQRQ